MALVRCSFYSDVLEVSTTMTVVLPQATTTQIGMAGSASVRTEGAPVLYLLHGMSDDETIWTRRTSIERYVADRGLAVVMPRVERSFYADEVHGHRYWTFLSEELPSLVDPRPEGRVRGAPVVVGGPGVADLLQDRRQREALADLLDEEVLRGLRRVLLLARP